MGHKPCCRDHPLAAATKLVGPTWLCRPQTQLYLFPFVPTKMKREDFIAFAIRRRRHILFFIWRADLESVSGSGEGEIAAIVIINLSPSTIP